MTDIDTQQDFTNRIPIAMADDDRHARYAQAAIKRRRFEPVTIEEIRADLRMTLGAIAYHTFVFFNGGRHLLGTQTQILAYAERAALYGTQDYPRKFEDDSFITALWDTCDNVHTSARAWRMGEYNGDGYGVILSIMKAARAAADGLPIPFNEGLFDEDLSDYDSGDEALVDG